MVKTVTCILTNLIVHSKQKNTINIRGKGSGQFCLFLVTNITELEGQGAYSGV